MIIYLPLSPTDILRILREKALLRLPVIPRDPSEYLVAVATHLKTREACLPTDFTWIKCRAVSNPPRLAPQYALLTRKP
jgi:hypothetical protein